MRKIFCFILPVIIILSLLGCGKKGDDASVPVEVFFRNAAEVYNNEEAIIKPEIWDFDGYENDLQGFLNLYLLGPVADDSFSPFPSGLQIVAIQPNEDRLCITLNDPYDELTGLDLTIASACLAKTVMGLTGCDVVEITSLNAASSIVMDREILLLLDDSSPNQ